VERREACASIARRAPRLTRRGFIWCAFRRSAPLVFPGGNSPVPPVPGSMKFRRRRARAAKNGAGGAMRHAEVRAQRASKHDAASFEARRKRGSHLRMTAKMLSEKMNQEKGKPPLTRAYKYRPAARCRPRRDSCRSAPRSAPAEFFRDWPADARCRSEYRSTRSRARCAARRR